MNRVVKLNSKDFILQKKSILLKKEISFNKIIQHKRKDPSEERREKS